jgi:hypothetical protein
MTIEEFRIIENFRNYEISNLGRVRAIKSDHFMSIRKFGSDSLTVSITDGKSKCFKV